MLLHGTHTAGDAVLCDGDDRPDLAVSQAITEPPIRVLATPNTPVPEVHLLSNGRYHVMVTNAGGGSSRWKDFAVTR